MIALYKKSPEKLCNSQFEHVWQDKERLSQFVCLTVEASKDTQKYIMSKFGKASAVLSNLSKIWLSKIGKLKSNSESSAQFQFLHSNLWLWKLEIY